MKIFSREFWGTVLIFLGVLLFLAVLYDAVRPFFPSTPQDQLVQKIVNSVTGFLRPGEAAAPTGGEPPPPEGPAAGQPAPMPPLPPPVPAPRPDGLLTGDVYQTRGDYYLWVWEVRPDKKTGEAVKVEIAHAAPGDAGAFEIVAFADGNGDGQPDREIARSDRREAEKAGDWSSLEFSSPEKRIFVGCAWPGRTGTILYRGNGPWPLSDSPFADRFVYSAAGPDSQSAGPAYTNMKVSFPR